MIELIKNANIAIIGGGRFCRMFLQFLDDAEFHFAKPRVLGVADSHAGPDQQGYCSCGCGDRSLVHVSPPVAVSGCVMTSLPEIVISMLAVLLPSDFSVTAPRSSAVTLTR